MVPLYLFFIVFTLTRSYEHLLQNISEYVERLTGYHLGSQFRARGLPYQRGGQVSLFHTPPGEVVTHRCMLMLR
jgi:hypothetical protein